MQWVKLAELLAPLFVNIGWPAVQFIIGKVLVGGDVTPEQWTELLTLANRNATTEALKVLAAQGIDPDSEQGKALLALVK